jgi:hypothetical protein
VVVGFMSLIFCVEGYHHYIGFYITEEESDNASGIAWEIEPSSQIMKELC